MYDVAAGTRMCDLRLVLVNWLHVQTVYLFMSVGKGPDLSLNSTEICFMCENTLLLLHWDIERREIWFQSHRIFEYILVTKYIFKSDS